MLTGTSFNSMDNKNRIIIPQQFRQEIGESLYVTVGYDDNLLIVSKANFEALAEKATLVPETSYESREYRRIFFGSAVACEVDKLGRIVLPKPLVGTAGIIKDVVIIGVFNKLELWGLEKYYEFIGRRTPQSKNNMLSAMTSYGV